MLLAASEKLYLLEEFQNLYMAGMIFFHIRSLLVLMQLKICSSFNLSPYFPGIFFIILQEMNAGILTIIKP